MMYVRKLIFPPAVLSFDSVSLAAFHFLESAQNLLVQQQAAGPRHHRQSYCCEALGEVMMGSENSSCLWLAGLKLSAFAETSMPISALC